ncbi:MAG: lysoplasmalogenase [Anaerolineae bacterium]
MNAQASWALGLGLLFAVVDWAAVIRANKRVEYVFKPAALLAIIAGALLLVDRTGWHWVALWFVPALGASLLGDVFLMLRDDRWFLPGLVAFLMAQICYIIGFNETVPPATSLWLLVPVAVLDWLVLSRVVRGTRDSGAPEMDVPVILYGLVLSLTLFSGWATWFRPGWSDPARLLASAGTTLFFASDLMLAWDRFVRQSRVLQVAVIITYHLAQLALAVVIGLAPR